MNKKVSSAEVELATMAVNTRGARSVTNLLLPVMTFNLHRDDPIDGPNSWEHRRDLCTTLINEFAPIIVCTQEGLKSQLEDLATALPAYEQFGMSRKGSGEPNDEHCAILYAGDKVEKIDGGTFWLSESPEVPNSHSWKAENPCIATWVTFHLKGVQQPGFAFQILSTHLDRHSSEARRRGAFLIWQHIATLPPSLPVIFCGSFNALKDSITGRFLLGQSREHGVAGDLRDGWATARQRRNDSLVYTQHGFKGERKGATEILKRVFMAVCLCWDRHNQDMHVDWILFHGRTLAPIYSEIVDYNVDGHYPSDHYPVYVEFALPRSVARSEEAVYRTLRNRAQQRPPTFQNLLWRRSKEAAM